MSFGTVQAEKVTTESGYSLGAGNASSFKNRIINGAMMIDQRNAGAAVSTSANTGFYTVDRFFATKTNGWSSGFTYQQVVDAPAGFVNSLKLTQGASADSIAGNVYSFVSQPIEGNNTADFGWGTANAKSVVVSFWVKSSVTGTFSFVVYNSASQSYVTTYTINSANTWEYKTIAIPGPTSGTFPTGNTSGISLFWGLGNSAFISASASSSWQSGNIIAASGTVNLWGTANATWQITGVQLEVGSTATSFDYRPYGTELALCQRYYENIVAGYVGSAVSGTNNGCMGQFLVEKRAAPTMTWVSTISALNFPTTAPVAYYISGTTKNFWPFKTANGTGQDSRYHDNYTASAEL